MSNSMPGPVGSYQSFAAYYDAYVGDFRGDFDIYLSLLYPGARPLEIGCGTGRLLQPALELGYQITGVDISEDMLARARGKLAEYIAEGQLRLVKHNLVDAALEETYGPVWVTFYTFNYIMDQQAAISFLGNLHHSMRDGGLLVMDLFCPTGLLNPPIQGQWTQRQFSFGKQSITLRDNRILQGKIEKRTQVYECAESREEIVTYRRFWDKQEMRELLSQTGFDQVMVTDGYDLNGYHPLAANERTESSFVIKACRC